MDTVFVCSNNNRLECVMNAVTWMSSGGPPDGGGRHRTAVTRTVGYNRAASVTVMLLFCKGWFGRCDDSQTSFSSSSLMNLVDATPWNGKMVSTRNSYRSERIKKRRRPGASDLCAVSHWENLRGGASSSAKKPKTVTKQTRKMNAKANDVGAETGTKTSTSTHQQSKKRKHAASSTKSKSMIETKDIIQQGLTKDAAQSLGDAIRDRANQLKADHYSSIDPNEDADEVLSPASQRVFDSMQSVGYAMGASDHLTRFMNGRGQSIGQNGYSSTDRASDESTDSNAGIEMASASVVVNYFLKSHGGAHALQCLCSILSATAGVAAMALSLAPNASTPLQRCSIQVSLLQRCMLFAMIKHVSGVAAALYMAAVQGIPAAGFRQTVVWIQDLVANPVSQYVFYAALMRLWLPSSTTTAAALCWWQSYRLVPIFIAGPVVVREVISTALVTSDVLVLWAYSNDNINSSDESKSSNSRLVQRGLTMVQAFVNAVMSLLVSPQSWRTATASKRQAILAKLTSRASLVLEICVGLLLMADAIWRGIAFVFFNSAPAAAGTVAKSGGSLGAWIKSLICARLYWQFLWTRRRKISNFLATVRGGAADVPLYVLSILEDPMSAMGITTDAPRAVNEQTNRVFNSKDSYRIQGVDTWTWAKYIRVAMGWDM